MNLEELDRNSTCQNFWQIRKEVILLMLYKYYVTDLGIAQIKNNKTETDKSYALENIVCNELIIKGYDVWV